MNRVLVGLPVSVWGFAALSSLGCAGTQTWWNDAFGPSKAAAPAKAADAPPQREGVQIAREDAGTPASTETASPQTAASEQSSDDIEERIRKYVEGFPEQRANSAVPDPAPATPASETTPTGTNEPLSIVAQPPSDEGSQSMEADSTDPAPPAPPVLTSVSVDDTPVAAPPPAEPAPVETSVNQGARLPAETREPGLSSEIADLERRVAEQPNDVNSQLRLRMFYLATGQDEKAAAPVAGVSKEMADMLAGLIEVVQASRSAAADPDTQADALLEAIDAYREQIKRHAELKVPTVAICSAADSYGVYSPFPPEKLIATGNEPLRVVVYCEIANFSSQQTPEGTYRTRLASQVEVLDADGRSVAMLSRKQFEDLSRNQREDFFLGEVVELPSSLEPGDYTLRVMIEDRGSGRFSSGSTRFTLRPPAS